MTVMRSLHTGASGLRAHQEALSVVGDNIANVNTVGFKRQRANFQDMLGRSVAGSGASPMAGAGSRLGSIQQMWTQGALLTTESPTDMAINGNGFFVAQGSVSGIENTYYTRAGQFEIDREGFLVTQDGLRLQGYQTDDSGNVGSTLGDLEIRSRTLTATPSTQVDLSVNLDSRTTAPAAAWDPANPSETSTHSTNVTVYDSLGEPREVTIYYRPTGTANQWEWHAMVDGGDVDGGTAGVPFEGASGTLTFDSEGRLDTETTTASSFDFTGAAPGQAIAFDFGDALTTDGGTGLTGSTQIAQESSNNGLEQDGYSGGNVSAIQVSEDGVITGIFTNGQRRPLGQVALADFPSDDGLERAGQGFWVETNDSGQPVIGAASTGGLGAVVSGALEGSNVDLGREFIDLIAYQRGFSANSRIVTTADEVYSELTGLKR